MGNGHPPTRAHPGHSDAAARSRNILPVLREETHDPGSASALTAAQLGRHPDHDLPPDDHPPHRWTADGHWADDPTTDHDLDTAVDSLVREINRTDRDRRATADRGNGPGTAGRRTALHIGADADELPPF